MFAGHFGLAALVKGRAPQVPLWSLLVATQLLDIVFTPLFLAGIERIDPVPGTSGGYGHFVITADWDHSLIGALVISALAGWAAAWRWGRRNGAVIAAVVFSHWLLDLLVHRADLAVLPGNAGGLPRLGLGLWASPAIALALELALVLGGAYLYYRTSVRLAPPDRRHAARLRGVALALGLVVVLALSALSALS